MSTELPVVLLHGYSDKGESLKVWAEELTRLGYEARAIRLASYISLSNEITIRDLAEAFDRALREEAGLASGEPFDAIVHSTGGLIIREWLSTYEKRRHRVKHIINLAPATFGSPMAAKGRSVLGAIFKGEKSPLRPDFMEAGDRVLSGLELGSSYTWDLAHKDLLAEVAHYGPEGDTPYPFVFIGLEDYGWLKRIATERGTDGTIRWTGASYNCRKICIDLTRDPAREDEARLEALPWRNAEVPLVLLPEINHGTILRHPNAYLVEMVAKALQVSDWHTYQEWTQTYSTTSMSPEHLGRHGIDEWQQFLVHAVDERGDAIPDYYVELCLITISSSGEELFEVIEDYQPYVHVFSEDPSYRSFQVNLSNVPPEARNSLGIRVTALSGTDLVAYHGLGSGSFTPQGDYRFSNIDPDERIHDEDGKWDARINLSKYLEQHPEIHFFQPFTTTLVELQLNREPMPPTGINRLLQFMHEEPR